MSHNVSSTGLAITNPLVLYRSLLATNRIRPDQGQYRLALHLQKLYERLKDYEPTIEYGVRLKQITGAIKLDVDSQRATARPKVGSRGLFASLLSQKEKRDSLALTRVLTSHEEALAIDSPRGFLLHGEVGTGKSMLIDLLADSLPSRKKRRLHYNTFMLDTLSKLEELRRSRNSSFASSPLPGEEYSILWLARHMIETHPILFLDEFQLPDRAASKIISNLLTGFFHLGGVLIATSNRMPEELAKAAGVAYTLPSSWTGNLISRLGIKGAMSKNGRSENMFAGKGEFAAFLEVLKARCEVWEMESTSDYRRGNSARHKELMDVPLDLQGESLMSSVTAQGSLEPTEEDLEAELGTPPEHYLLVPPPSSLPENFAAFNMEYERTTRAAVGVGVDVEASIPWRSTTLLVYGRRLTCPRAHNGTAYYTFNELCGASLGPADYITLASTFHTFIVSEVPVLTTLLKNEARRLITFLDAIYEARCKLMISAATTPDELFFPDTAGTTGDPANAESEGGVYAETFAEAYQDTIAPFRPNVSSYTDSPDVSVPSEPDSTHARLQGILSDDALEDDPPNRVRRTGIAVGTREGEGDILKRRPLDFGRTSAFTGEDERFAYKRASSRLYELCSARWWNRDEPGWWRPLPAEQRHWEISSAERALKQAELASEAAKVAEDLARGEGLGISREVTQDQDEIMFRHEASPFRTYSDPPPKINWTHIWGTMKWGKRAGAWGQGVEGLSDRKKAKKEQK